MEQEEAVVAESQDYQLLMLQSEKPGRSLKPSGPQSPIVEWGASHKQGLEGGWKLGDRAES